MTTALAAIHDATYGGVYYSADIDFTNTGVQPTWTRKATTGLANTLIKVMQNDSYTPYDNIYVQLDNDNIYRWNGASWTAIMDLATARTLAGQAAGLPGYITVDKGVAGSIYWVLAQTGIATKILKSLDYGANWSVVAMPYDLYTGSPYLQVYGQYMHVCIGSIYRSIHYSANSGAGFADISIWPNSAGGQPIRIDPHRPTMSYYRDDATSFELIEVNGTLGTKTIKQNGVTLGSDYHDWHWIDPLIAGHQRILRNTTDTKLFATTDNWATLVDATPAQLSASIDYSALAAARENDDYILYGDIGTARTGHKVFAINGETSAVTWGINGANVSTPPYTNAIPGILTTYVAVQGLFVGAAPASSGVYTYADEYGADITTLTSEPVIPMPGDRSSWFDLDADEDDDGNPFSHYHAQDISDLTPQRHAPWSIPAPTAGKGIVSDGSKWVISAAALALITDLHAAVTLGADAEVLLSLIGQQIVFDTQTANYIFAGPTSGAAADPVFRAMVAADIAAGGDATKYLRGDLTWQTLSSVVLDYIHEHAINEDLSGLCDGARTVFILANEYKIETTAVYLNGVRQLIVTDYTEDAGYDQITMTTAPEAGDILIIDYVLADAIP